MSKKLKLVGINGRFSHSTLALFYVRNEIEKHTEGCSCELLQCTINDPYYELLLKLSTDAPDYILFSAAIWNSTVVERLCRDLLVCLPGCQLIIGGPQAGPLAGRLADARCVFVIGAIEEIGAVFFTDLHMGRLKREYRQIKPGYRSDFGYPYRHEDFSTHLANRYIYYESSRGCPFRCSYCLSSIDRAILHKNIAVVEEELRDLLSHRPKVVRFIDRTFNDIPQRALAIWQFLLKHGQGTLFHFEIAPDRFTEEMFAFLATVPLGLFQFEIGVQTTNTETLASIDRRIDPVLAHENITRLANCQNIHLHVDLILGLPFETTDSFARSFSDIFSMGAHYIQMGLLKILPNTPLAEQSETFGYRHCAEPPYNVLANKWLTHQDLSHLFWFSECVEKFVNNRYFVSLWAYLREQREDGFLFFAALLDHCRNEGFFSLAATQELMSKMILGIAAARTDAGLITDIVRFDWLRCGFRYLPDFLLLDEGREQPAATRSRLYQDMPGEYDGLYTRSERNYFFRKSFFLEATDTLLESVGLGSAGPQKAICFLTDKEAGIHQLCRVVVL